MVGYSCMLRNGLFGLVDMGSQEQAAAGLYTGNLTELLPGWSPTDAPAHPPQGGRPQKTIISMDFYASHPHSCGLIEHSTFIGPE